MATWSREHAIPGRRSNLPRAERVRALIVGLGAVGQRHARNLRALRPGIELIAWRQRGRLGVIRDDLSFDPDADPAAVLGIRAYPDLDAALATSPDVTVICTPPSHHVPVALRALTGGCHLFIEKPVSHSLDGLARLQAAAAERVRIVAVGCQWRFHPCVEYLRHALWTTALGRTKRVDIDFSEYLPEWHPYEDYRESYAAQADLGGGVVLSQIHDYDLAHWLCGPPRSVFATGGRVGDLEVNVEDTVQAQVDCAAATVFVRQTFAERERHRRITVQAEGGTIHCDLLAAQVKFSDPPGGGLDIQAFDRNDMFLDVMRDFLTAVEGGGAPRTALADGIAVLRTALGVRESIRTRRPVDMT